MKSKVIISALMAIAMLLSISGCSEVKDASKDMLNGLKDAIKEQFPDNDDHESSEEYVSLNTMTLPPVDSSPAATQDEEATTDFECDYFSVKASDIWKIDSSDDYSCSYVYADTKTDEEYAVYISIYCFWQGGYEYYSLDEYIRQVREVNDKDFKLIYEKEFTFKGYVNKELMYLVLDEGTTKYYSQLMHIQTKEDLYSICIVHENEKPSDYIQQDIDKLLDGISFK